MSSVQGITKALKPLEELESLNDVFSAGYY